MKYKLAIFDLDGTILNTLDDLAAAINHALAENGLPVRTVDEVRRFVGNGYRMLVCRAVPAGSNDDVIDGVLEAFKTYYNSHCDVMTRPYDGIPELLKALRGAGIKTAVVSNKGDYGVRQLCARYFPELFDFTCGEKENVRRKPAPDSVNAVLEALAADRSEAVYIGDSDVDIETAANAGMDCISVDWGFRERGFLIKSGARTIVSEPDGLSKLIIG